jgi:hypothetical protein
MTRVLRMDSGSLASPVKTEHGLIVEGHAGRPGVYRYRRQDGSEWRELRLPEEVFSPESLASYRAAPVTIGHHGLIAGDPDKRAKFGSGAVLRARQDGDKVAFAAALDDSATDAAGAGKNQISPGYTMEIERKAGTHAKYGRYDAIQRSIRVDHLALTDEARGGGDLQIRLDDGETLVRLDDESTGDNMPQEPEETTPAESGIVKTLREQLADLQARLDSADREIESERLAEERKRAEAAIEKLRKYEETREDDLRQACELRLNVQKAIPGHRIAGKNDQQLRVEVIKRFAPAEKLDGVAAKYIVERADSLLEYAIDAKSQRGQVREQRQDSADPAPVRRRGETYEADELTWEEQWKRGLPRYRKGS